MSSDSTTSESPLIEEGLESPIENFVFRQCPAEFNLKISTAGEVPTWSKGLAPPKASLLQISHAKGLILFPHHEKGLLGYASIDKLAERETISTEILKFSQDESLIISMCLDPSEKFLFVAKASKKIYAINLGANEVKKRPFIVGTSNTLESQVVQCACSDVEMWVVLENGDLLFFDITDEGNLLKTEELVEFDEKFGCLSSIEDGILAVGSKDEPKLYFVNLNEEQLKFQSIDVPCDELNCGSKGISSIHLFPNLDGVLFSCVPDNPETDDVPLLLFENMYNGKGFKFSTYFDPCASRPPRKNQFYFLNSPFKTDNLCDFVVVGNFASPDIGICGRLAPEDVYQTFFIDNDEGLAQLPFINGEMIYPVGLALDLSSNTLLENLNNPDADKFPPAPILWILTSSGHLCPFSMLKTDETEPFDFMKTVPVIESFGTDTAGTDANKSEEKVTVVPVASIEPQTPQTPSKVPLEQLTSLQKSAEIKPIRPEITSTSSSAGTSSPFSFKPAPVEQKPMKPVMLVGEQPVKPAALPMESTKPATLPTESVKSIITSSAPVKPEISFSEPVELEVPELIKKEEKMESINEGAYKNILLAEIAATHAAMQDDLFILKQLTLKNSLLLRQNCQKYFNSLESLEAYAGSLEKLVSSSDKVFLGIKDKLDDLKFDLNELVSKTKQIKSTWNRIKQDNKIDWDARMNILNSASQELIERMERVRNFMSNPTEASKYHATLKSFVDSTQEKIQVLMAHLSGLFVSQNEDISTSVYADFEMLSLSPTLSSENLLDQLKVLSLEGSLETVNTSNRIEKRNKSLLNAVKSRGARLSIPNKISPSITGGIDSQKLKLSAEDESLISSFISSIKLTEDVPEFAETARIAKLSLSDEPATAKVLEPVKPAATFEFKPAEPKPAFDFKSAETKSTPFSFKPLETSNEPKPTETKPALFSFKQEESKPSPFAFKPAETKPADPKPTFEFKPSTESKPSSESKPTFEFKRSAGSKPVFDFKAPTESKPVFEFKPTEPKSLDDKPVSEVKPVETEIVKDSESENLKAVESKNALDCESEPSDTPKSTIITSESTPKIPSIFTVKSQPEEEQELKKESSLPSFDSLSFGGGDKCDKFETSEFKSEPAAVKPFPSIFGVKPPSDNNEIKSSPIAPIATTATVVKPAETVSASVPTSGFGFNFKPQSPEPVTTSVPSSTSVKSEHSPKQSAFSFAPSASSGSGSAFSITNKPTFSLPLATTSSPIFGAPSLPKSSASFGSTTLPSSSTGLAPAFGQTSFPSSGQTSGFAAFAANSAASQNTSSFSSFASVGNNNQPSTGLTFASFLPSEKDKKDNNKNGNNNNPSSTFSFTGFRE